MLRAMIAIQTYGLLSYIGECAWYWAFMEVVHTLLFALGVGVLALASRYRRGQFRSWFVHWALFSLCSFIMAGLMSGLWSCLVFGRLYWSTDYVFDFTPFWPVTQRTLDHSFGGQVGGLLGISLFPLQALWLLFATITWLSAGYTTHLTMRWSERRTAPRLALR